MKSTVETQSPSIESETIETETPAAPLRLSLRRERLKNLGVRTGVQAGATCHECTPMIRSR